MDDRENLFSILHSKFWPFWPLFLSLLILGLIAAKLYLVVTPKMYESTAALVVNDEKKGVDESQVMESFNVFESKKIVENEIEVLRSKDILNDVVVQLGLYSEVVEKGLFGDRSVYSEGPIEIKVKDLGNSDTFEDTEKVSFYYNWDKKTIELEGKEVALDTWVENPDGGSELMFVLDKSITYVGDGDFYYLLTDPKTKASQLLANLYVGAASKLATVVRLTYTDPLPQRGEDILEQLIESYKKAAMAEQNSLASNTLTFVEGRMEEVKGELEEVERELEKYRASEGVINLSEQGNLYLENVGDYDRRIADINLQLSVLNKVENYVVSKDQRSGIVPSTLGINDPILSQLLQRLYDAEIEYEQLRKTTAENNPILVSIRNRIDLIRPSILENVRSQKSNLQASKSSLSGNSGKYSDALKVLPEQERKFVEISRKKKSISDLYDFLVQKREETALSYAPTAGNARVIESPETGEKPVSPKTLFVYLVGLFVPLGLGMSWVAGKELLNSNVLYRSELESYSELPVLGELAFVDKPKEELLVNEHQDLFVTDQFRQLLSYLGVYKHGDHTQTILVTSSIMGEGKSYVSTNLAMTVALSGRKTALVDLDLRVAGASEIFGLTENIGISDVLLGKATATEIAVQSEGDLTIFPAGKKALNSSELIAMDSVAEFINVIKKEFEVVIIDSPPINMVSDASMLANYSDRTLLSVRHGHTPKFIVKRLDAEVAKNKLPDCSLVFNGVKPRGSIKQNYGYGYGYEVVKESKPISFLGRVQQSLFG